VVDHESRPIFNTGAAHLASATRLPKHFGPKSETNSSIIERLWALSGKAVIVLTVFYKGLDGVVGAKIAAPTIQLRLFVRFQP
jgi:hypothetical protein